MYAPERATSPADVKRLTVSSMRTDLMVSIVGVM